MVTMNRGYSIFKLHRSDTFYFTRRNSCAKSQELNVVVWAIRNGQSSAPSPTTRPPAPSLTSLSSTMSAIEPMISPARATAPGPPSPSPSPGVKPPEISPATVSLSPSLASKPPRYLRHGTDPKSPSQSPAAVTPSSSSPSPSTPLTPSPMDNPPTGAPAPARSSSTTFTPSVATVSSVIFLASVCMGSA